MKPQVVFDDWWKVGTEYGDCFVPYDVVGYNPKPVDFHHFVHGRLCGDYEKVEGYGARMFAPGYTDCTDWALFDTEKEAWDYLKETYDVED